MAAALAMHFMRGRLLPQAVPYLRQAGQHAAQRGAHQEAVAFYEQALHALQQLATTPDTLAQAIDLRFALHEALFPLGAYRQLFNSLCESEHSPRRSVTNDGWGGSWKHCPCPFDG
jgi:hypothetical protein